MIRRRSTRQGILILDKNPKIYVPIYGLTEIPIAKQSGWESDPAYIAAVQLKNWTGDPPVEFSFSWSLIAGTNPEVKDRDILMDYVKIAQAMCSYQKVPTEGRVVIGPPPRVKLILGDYVAALGVLMKSDTIARGPFTSDVGAVDAKRGGVVIADGIANLKPTQVDFSITFITLPGYMPDDQIISVDKNLSHDADSVLQRLYKTF